jgi:HD-GYP domain-containing protein (c-di-GMP phosphodiesterase class II)
MSPDGHPALRGDLRPLLRARDHRRAAHGTRDGGGYHLGLAGDRLNRDARILAVADVYEALTAERPYRAAPDEVRAIMRRDGGRALCLEALGALEASQELGVLSLATPAPAAARPAAR